MALVTRIIIKGVFFGKFSVIRFYYRIVCYIRVFCLSGVRSLGFLGFDVRFGFCLLSKFKYVFSLNVLCIYYGDSFIICFFLEV